jgi:tetratricopeptide (TPR) repeat protein
MNTEQQEQFRAAYREGKHALESGKYRRSIEYLETAIKLVPINSKLGGEVKIWLVTAYQAAGLSEQAIALCQQLLTHPYSEVRQQAKELLYIMQAPELKRPREWMSEIPDLSKIGEGDGSYFSSKGKIGDKPKKKYTPTSLDLSQINTKDNRFIWVALAALILILGSLIWRG